MFLIQCDLEKVYKNIVKRTTAFIPQRFAIFGKYLEILVRDNGKNIWENGWKVVSVYKNSIEEERELDKISEQYRNTRKASDI